jgi:hypothetical protein
LPGVSVGFVLHGREPERAQLAALLEDAAHARAGALVVHGEAGTEKTALLDDLVAGAVGARPLRPVLDRLPAPQARSASKKGRLSTRSWSRWRPCRC